MRIWFKGCYDLRTIHDFHVDYKKSSIFWIPLNNGFKISVDINYETKKIEAVSQYEISDELYTWIIKELSLKKPETKEDIKNELNQIISDFDFSVKRVVSLIKYCLNQFRIDDDLVLRSGIEWSMNNSEYRHIGGTAYYWVGYVQSVLLIDEKIIQKYLDNRCTPFLALKFLHRAINEDIPNFRVLDATTAAELAIKEFLIRKNDDLKTLLLELPSPPLDKLYGPILKRYGGQESPKRKVLKLGSEIRNLLIHTPNELEIPRHLALFYCNNVQFAIYHLLHLLYPDDELVKRLNSPSISLGGTEYERKMIKALTDFRDKLKQLKKVSALNLKAECADRT